MVNFLVLSLAVFISARLLDGVEIRSYWTALGVAFGLSLVNVLLKPILVVQEDQLISYLRIVPPGHHFKEPALGRIIVSRKYRGSNLGPELIQNGIQLCRQTYPNEAISIEAQHPLQAYYEQFGFASLGPVYDVDDIPHIHMKLEFFDES